MAEVSKRELWIKKGWARGAFIDLNAYPNLLNTFPLNLRAVLAGKDAYLIPLLYDCSLIEECFIREPWVQVLICWPCTQSEGDGNFKFGKNPRKIHFPVTVNGDSKYFNAEAISFYQLERELLLSTSPVSNIQWPDKGLYQLLNWVAERYNQPTFPDEWNVRMNTKKRQLDKLWKKDSFVNNCSGLYLNISPFGEINEEDTYTLNAYIVISSTLTGKEHRDFIKSHEDELLQQFKSVLSNIANININMIDTIKEDQFTKAMERDFQRWQLEHLSYKNIEQAPLPAELDIK